MYLQGTDFLESVDAVQYRAVCAAPKGVTDTALNEIRKSEKRKSTSVAFVLADLEKEQERRAKVRVWERGRVVRSMSCRLGVAGARVLVTVTTACAKMAGAVASAKCNVSP